MAKEYKRWQVENTQNALRNRRVVAISGARQTGKTTITRQIDGNDGIFRNLDDASMLKAAKNDPKEFVKNLSDEKTMIIDEIQKAPSLISDPASILIKTK